MLRIIVVSLIGLSAGLITAACEPRAGGSMPVTAAENPTAAPSSDADLLAFLADRTRDASGPLRYAARTHGDGDQTLTLVYLVGPAFCGSGGCKLLILAPDGDSYAVLGDTTVTQTPIRVLSSQSHGRPDIGVRVRGGGAGPGHEARLTFDGDRYPSNPTVVPAQGIEAAPGVTMITDETPLAPLKG